MNFNIWKTSAVVFFSTMLIGCSSSVPQVRASLPLVHAEQTSDVGQALPVELSELISESYLGQAFIYKNYQLNLGREFFSALGQRCKEVYFSDLDMKTGSYLRVMCLKNNSWRLLPVITEQNNLHLDMEEEKYETN